MELATGTPSRQVPKALSKDAWGEFLRRVLVSASRDTASEQRAPVADGPLPRRAGAGEPPGRSASEQ